MNSNGSMYCGEWRDHKPHGKGFEKYEDGSSYVGFFKDGMKDGNGEF